MLGDAEITNRPKRNLADADRGPSLNVEQLAIVGDPAASEGRPAGMLERGFGSDRIVIVTMEDLAPPGERTRQLPARRDLARIERTCRPALLVHARLEL